jgi:hypothetical protein
MKMSTISLFALISLLYLSCNNNATSIQTMDNTQKMALDTFSFKDIPDSLHWASCLCSDNKIGFDSNKFIFYFLTSGPKYAVISVNHKFNYLRVVSTDSSLYSNDTYTITLSKTISDRDDLGENTDEGDIYRLIGKMTVKNKEGQSISLPLYGTCGN